jgi:Kef-type K+ transport system membrane component KefB
VGFRDLAKQHVSSGVVLGPHVLGLFGEHAPVADFFAELGKFLLMFFAGLEIEFIVLRSATCAKMAGSCGRTSVRCLYLPAEASLRFCRWSS